MNKSTLPSENLPKLVLTREETAHALSVSVQTIDRLAKNGHLRPSRVGPFGRRPRYMISELDRYLRETMAEAVA